MFWKSVSKSQEQITEEMINEEVKKRADLFNSMIDGQSKRYEAITSEAARMRRVCDLCLASLSGVGMEELSQELRAEVDKVFG